MKAKYELIVGNIGVLSYTNIKEAKKDFQRYVAQSKVEGTRAYLEPVSLLKDGEEIDGYTPNLVMSMLNMDKVKELIKKCPSDETVILCPHWSINKPDYPETSDILSETGDLIQLENILSVRILITDYNDLVADPHGIFGDI